MTSSLVSPNSKQLLIVFVIGFVMLFSERITILAQTKNSPKTAQRDTSRLALKTEKVVIFKDGYALVVKKGIARTNQDGEVYTDEVPDAAVLGSFWATPVEGRLLGMTAGWRTNTEMIEKEVDCTAQIDILLSNLGKKAVIDLVDNKQLYGTIHNVLTSQNYSPLSSARAGLREAFSSPDASNLASEAANSAASRPPTELLLEHSGSHFVLRTDEKDVLLAVSQIKTLSIKEMNTKISRRLKKTSRSKRLTFRFAEADKQQELTLIYFRPGVRWVPTYRLELSPNDKNKMATISLQAELLNEAEDIVDASIDLVVGVPNFRFRTTPSPLVLERVMLDALAQSSPQLMGQMMNNSFSNGQFAQRSSEIHRGRPTHLGSAESSIADLPKELTAGGAQDLFIYSLDSLTLRRGERAAIPIFQIEAPYRDVYTWDIHQIRHDIETSPSASRAVSPLKISKNEVWRQIELTNNSDLPWTTGAAMLMFEGRPLAQELLTYTPPGANVRVPVTVSVDTRGDMKEREIARKLNSLQWDGRNYAKIEKEVSLSLHNFKSIPVDVEISLRLGGKAVKASDEGKITIRPYDASDWQQYHGSPAVNNSSTISWKATIAPGTSFNPQAQYHYYSRH